MATSDDVKVATGVNVIDINRRHGLWSFGLDGAGAVEFWDPRSRTALTRLQLPTTSLLPVSSVSQETRNLVGGEKHLAVTALQSHADGLSMAVGTSTGHVLLYDLRSPKVFASKDQGYGEDIKRVEWMSGGEGRIISADSKVVKVWTKNNVSGFARVAQTITDD